MTMPTTNPNDDDPTQRQQTPEARRAAFYADALASWGECQQDGWCLRWEEVRSWLASRLVSGDGKYPLECHKCTIGASRYY